MYDKRDSDHFDVELGRMCNRRHLHPLLMTPCETLGGVIYRFKSASTNWSWKFDKTLPSEYYDGGLIEDGKLTYSLAVIIFLIKFWYQNSSNKESSPILCWQPFGKDSLPKHCCSHSISVCLSACDWYSVSWECESLEPLRTPCRTPEAS